MEAFRAQPVPHALEEAAGAFGEAEHILFVFPLWLGTMPALLKAFLEQVMRPFVAFAYPEPGKTGFARSLLKGRSARLVVTMGMPALVYRFWYLGHGIACLRRNILNFVGIGPVRQTLLGNIDGASDATRAKWLASMRKLGARRLKPFRQGASLLSYRSDHRLYLEMNLNHPGIRLKKGWGHWAQPGIGWSAMAMHRRYKSF